MALIAETRLGFYEILAPFGAGGMGEVLEKAMAGQVLFLYTLQNGNE